MISGKPLARQWLVWLAACVAMIMSAQAHVQAQSRQGEPMRLVPHPIFLTIDTAAGPVRYVVEIADEQDERQRGLMFRTDLPADQGMLFVFDQTRMVTMWMDNTPASLDMLFIADDGRIAHIARATTPFSRAVISSQTPVRYVLELNVGQVAINRIAIGQKVRHPIITTQ